MPPTDALVLFEEPDGLRQPVLIVAFSGWNDAAESATTAARYLGQLWLFWVAPIIGAVIAGLVTRWMYEEEAIVDTIVVEERRVTP